MDKVIDHTAKLVKGDEGQQCYVKAQGIIEGFNNTMDNVIGEKGYAAVKEHLEKLMNDSLNDAFYEVDEFDGLEFKEDVKMEAVQAHFEQHLSKAFLDGKLAEYTNEFFQNLKASVNNFGQAPQGEAVHQMIAKDAIALFNVGKNAIAQFHTNLVNNQNAEINTAKNDSKANAEGDKLDGEDPNLDADFLKGLSNRFGKLNLDDDGSDDFDNETKNESANQNDGSFFSKVGAAVGKLGSMVKAGVDALANKLAGLDLNDVTSNTDGENSFQPHLDPMINADTSVHNTDF